VRDAVVLNAGIALALTEQDPQGGPGAGTEAGTDAGPVAGTGMDHAAFTAQVRAGMDRAERAIDDGAASAVVARWVAATRD
jgi:anthranilate phosphoribosyltransferase